MTQRKKTVLITIGGVVVGIGVGLVISKRIMIEDIKMGLANAGAKVSEYLKEVMSEKENLIAEAKQKIIGQVRDHVNLPSSP